MELHQGMVIEQQVLPALPLALDELDHAAAQAVTYTACEHAEGGGALALAVARQHHQQALVERGCGDAGVDVRLLALHGPLVTGLAFGIRSGCAHGISVSETESYTDIAGATAAIVAKGLAIVLVGKILQAAIHLHGG